MMLKEDTQLDMNNTNPADNRSELTTIALYNLLNITKKYHGNVINTLRFIKKKNIKKDVRFVLALVCFVGGFMFSSLPLFVL
jgi:hypothetical protein